AARDGCMRAARCRPRQRGCCAPWACRCAPARRRRHRPAPRRNRARRCMFDAFTLVLIANGLLVGMMYALIALGFVLVYKATEAFNFAQGEFVMTGGFVAAAAAAVMPFWAAAL